MEAAEVADKLVGSDPNLRKRADDLKEIGGRFASIRYEPVRRGDVTCRGLSWRCRAIAYANLLRGEELLRFGILAVNEGAIITAYTLSRALDETLAAVVFARRRIQRSIESGNADLLGKTLDKVTSGNRYRSERGGEQPAPFNILTMIDDTGRQLNEMLPSGERKEGEFREHYEFISEFVHPSQGSFSIYQRTDDENEWIIFDRTAAERPNPLPMLLSALRMSAGLLLREAEALADIGDLPQDWPDRNRDPKQ